MLGKYINICEQQYTVYLKYPKDTNSESKHLFTIWRPVHQKAIIL